MPGSKEKLVLSTRNHYHLVEIENIIYCQCKNAITTFFMNDGEEISVSTSLKSVENKLKENSFIRPHQSFLVNVKHIRSVQKNAFGELVLNNGKTIAISSRKKTEVLHFLDNLMRIQV